ncbi:MbtH family NRPS accessory protein [Kocuria sp. KH4]
MNPFDDPHAEMRVVLDGHGHPSLWPAALPVPFGWTTSRCPAPRPEAQSCLDSLRHEAVLGDDLR